MKHLVLLFSVALVIFSCSSNNNGTVTVVPLAPTNLTGSTISTTQINLSWTDNATNEDGYKIERKTGSGSYAVIGSTATNLTTFSDLGLTPNTSYTYRVYAYNSAGNSVQYSNEITIVTQDSIPSWLTNGLVGYWPFNGNANDESGNGNNGTVNGATLTSDRNGNSGKAYSFDGFNNYISVNRNFLSKFTLSVWFFSANSQLYNPLVDAFDANWEIQLKNNSPDYVSFISANNYQEYISTQTISNNNWYHLVCTYSSNVVKLYLNGNLTDQFNVNPLTNNNGNYNFGASLTGADQFFNGSLDDIRIYNRALSSSEVAYLAAH